MKITTIEGEILDTDKMDDVTAEITEKLKEFHDVCAKYNVPFLTRILLKNSNTATGAINLNNEEDFKAILFDLNEYLLGITEGKVGLSTREEE